MQIQQAVKIPQIYRILLPILNKPNNSLNNLQEFLNLKSTKKFMTSNRKDMN